jgi:hypothetical protein
VASEPPKTSLDIETEAREARKNSVLAAKAWGIALGALFPAVYTPLRNVKVVFVILSLIGGFAALGGALGAAKAIFHGATVLVLRPKSAWQLPMQITIALGVPLLLSLFFLRHGVPTWAAIQPLLSWDMLIPLVIIAFLSRAGGSLLDRTVPVRGFLIAAYLLFVLCMSWSLEFTSRSEGVARYFVVYLMYVAVSYGGMLFSFLKAPQKPSLSPEKDEIENIIVGAMAVASAYGKVLEENSQIYGLAIPISKLPFPKDHIKRAIAILYSALQKENIKDFIRRKFPNQSEHILSEKYLDSLMISYSFLPHFVSQEESELFRNFYNITAREKLQEMLRNPERFHEEIVELAHRFADTSVIEIVERIHEEGMQYLAELEAYRGQVHDEVKKIKLSAQRHRTLSKRQPILWASLIGLAVLGVIFYNQRQAYLGHLKDCERYGVSGEIALRDCAKKERYHCCQFQYVLPSQAPGTPAYGKRFVLTDTLHFSPPEPSDKPSDNSSLEGRYFLGENLFLALHIDIRTVPEPIQTLIRFACDELPNLCTNVTLYGVIDVIGRLGRDQLGVLGLRVEHITFQPQPLDP